ncbi:MAG: Druantia anti-phage system protein DruA [bacterium]
MTNNEDMTNESRSDRVVDTVTEADTHTRSPDELANQVREQLLAHLKALGVNGEKRTFDSKEAIRKLHAPQREEQREEERGFVQTHGPRLLREHFADGEEVEPENVRPMLHQITGSGDDSRLFRLATLLWSVPVSRGYGRRIRFLVRDASNDKLMGIFALGSPVFNLSVRDDWIGWDTDDRRERLVNVMDAYVVGAMPPYSQLIGGKVVASLMTSQDVCDIFHEKYRDRRGVISGKKKEAQLAVVTVTSALGRSSLYNRLRLRGLFEFLQLGYTEGWGHFHVPDDLFEQMRRLLQLEDHKYSSGNRFGDGPNWRLRVIRVALGRMGLDEDLLRHGIRREVYAAPIAENWQEYLLGETDNCHIDRPSASEIGQAAVERWLIPRSERRPGYRSWTKLDTWQRIWPESDITTHEQLELPEIGE